METNPTLRQIYNNLQDGRIYGYDFTKCKYPFFDPVLYLTKDGYIYKVSVTIIKVNITYSFRRND